MRRIAVPLIESVTILVIVLILAVTGCRTVSQLGRAIDLQHLTRMALRLDYAVLQYGFEEEAGIHGYALSGDKTFLERYAAASRRAHRLFPSLLRACRALTLDARVVSDMLAVQDRWQRTVAVPVVRTRSIRKEMRLADIALIDRFRSDDQRLDAAIEAQANRAAQATRRAILEILLTGTAMVFIALVAAALSRLGVQALNVELQKEKDIVGRLRTAFTSRAEELPGLAVGTAYLAADNDRGLGGDLFDIYRLDAHRGYVLVADVSGKGIAAAANTALIRYSARAIAAEAADPGLILRKINRLFIQGATELESFAAAFIAVFDRTSAVLRYASAGLGSVYLKRRATVEQLPVTGPLIGVEEAAEFATAGVGLTDGDLLIIATDGLTEARRPDGRILDDDGAMGWIGELSIGEPQAFVDGLTGRLRRLVAGTTNDDLALVALQFTAQGETSPVNRPTTDESPSARGRPEESQRVSNRYP